MWIRNKESNVKTNMKKIIFLLLILGLILSSCNLPRRFGDPGYGQQYKTQYDMKKIEYLGGDGSSFEKAIIIKNAESDFHGILAEYAYLEKKYGKRGTVWDRNAQSYSECQKKKYDILEIEFLESKETMTVYFDITGFYGKN